MTSLEYTGGVSVHASVVNWLLSSRQLPTVAGIASLLPVVVGLYSCRDSHTVHEADSMPSPQCWMVVPEQVDDASVLGSGDCSTLLSEGASLDSRCRPLMAGKNGLNWVDTVSTLTLG